VRKIPRRVGNYPQCRPAARLISNPVGREVQSLRGAIIAALGAMSSHQRCDRLVVVLVRPTRYDEDGYVVRHWRGTLPSNTLSCLHGLTEEVIESGVLAPLVIEVHTLDEAVDRIDPPRLARGTRRSGTRVLVALAGVQTNQFPRARDLAVAFKRHGCDVMIGGFHVTPFVVRRDSPWSASGHDGVADRLSPAARLAAYEDAYEGV
jgi:hypothetical protein